MPLVNGGFRIVLRDFTQPIDLFLKLAIRLENLDPTLERQFRFFFACGKFSSRSVVGKRLVELIMAHVVFSCSQLQREFFRFQLASQSNLLDCLRQVTKTVVDFRQPRHVFRRVAFAFSDRFPNLQRVLGSLENMKVLTKIFTVLCFARRQLNRSLISFDRFCLESRLPIEVSNLRVGERIFRSCFDNATPNLDCLLAPFRFFNIAILHHQLAPVAKEVRIPGSRLNQQRILF